jgi:hypothetical protein
MLKQFSITVASLFLFLGSGLSLFAQPAMFMGRILDTENIPVAKAGIYLSGPHGSAVLLSDDSGLFTSAPLPKGRYRLKLIVNNREINGGKVRLTSGKYKKYYHFSLKNYITITAIANNDNPYMEAELNKVAASDQRIDY